MAIPHPATRVHLLALTALCPALVSGEGDTGAAQKGNSYTLEVAEHAAAFAQYFLHDVRVTQVQLDELFALLSAVKTGEISEAEEIGRASCRERV